MDLYIFARFHVREGQEAAAESALRDVVPPTRAEAGCVRCHVFRSTRDPRLFYIHSHWRDSQAFDMHVDLPHTVVFLKRMDALLDQPREVTRSEMLV